MAGEAKGMYAERKREKYLAELARRARVAKATQRKAPALKAAPPKHRAKPARKAPALTTPREKPEVTAPASTDRRSLIGRTPAQDAAILRSEMERRRRVNAGVAQVEDLPRLSDVQRAQGSPMYREGQLPVTVMRPPMGTTVKADQPQRVVRSTKADQPERTARSTKADKLRKKRLVGQ